MEIREKDRELFMKYALPCAGTLVKRNNIGKDEWNKLIWHVKNGEKIPTDSERIFKVAFAACSLLAIDRGKKEIDEEIIRQYYRFEHDKMIDLRYEEMGDFDPAACRIRPGVVKSVIGNHAFVENSFGMNKYRTDYCKVKEGDHVVTHWDFVVEKIKKSVAEEMRHQKNIMSVI